MRKLEALRRVEELTYQVEALTKENTKLRIQICDTREQTDRVAEELAKAKDKINSQSKRIAAMDEELKSKYMKIGNLMRDNSRLLSINAYLAGMAGKRPAVSRIDKDANWIGKEEER